jgi:hypothetical protein
MSTPKCLGNGLSLTYFLLPGSHGNDVHSILEQKKQEYKRVVGPTAPYGIHDPLYERASIANIIGSLWDRYLAHEIP